MRIKRTPSNCRQHRAARRRGDQHQNQFPPDADIGDRGDWLFDHRDPLEPRPSAEFARPSRAPYGVQPATKRGD
jgi:hypothetical protein